MRYDIIKKFCNLKNLHFGVDRSGGCVTLTLINIAPSSEISRFELGKGQLGSWWIAAEISCKLISKEESLGTPPAFRHFHTESNYLFIEFPAGFQVFLRFHKLTDQLVHDQSWRMEFLLKKCWYWGLEEIMTISRMTMKIKYQWFLNCQIFTFFILNNKCFFIYLYVKKSI